MSLIAAHGIVKRYGPTTILDGVSITIEEKDRLGLIGRNGAGKSTLTRILAGTEEPEAGELMRRRGLSLAVVEQAPKLEPSMTVEAAVLTGLAHHQALHDELGVIESRLQTASETELSELIEHQARLLSSIERHAAWNSSHQADAISNALRLPPKHRTLGQLSLGELRRVALAVGLLEAPELLVLDEPTNHLDVETIEWLEVTLRAYQGALVLVTHDRYFLDNVATRIAEIDRGELRAYDGNYTEYLVKKAERAAIEARTEHHRQRAIEAELVWVRASAPARTTKQKARLDRFDAVVANRPKAEAGEVKFRLPHPPRLGKTILELHQVSKAYGDRTLVRNLDLLLKKGDHIGVLGPNGAGKTTLLRMILGETTPDSGEIVRPPNTVVVYADQARADLDEELSVLEEVAGDGDKVYVGDTAIQVQAFLGQLLFSDSLQRMKVGALSGGEKSRVSLAKALRQAGNLLILDEPTNDLDLATLRVLEEAIVEYPGCALIVSHDRYFLDRVTTAILAFEGDGRVVLYEGSHQSYRDRLSASASAKLATEPEPERKETRPAVEKRSNPAISARKKRRSWKEEQEWKGMEAAILSAEDGASKIEQELCDPESARKLGAGLPDRMQALERTKREVERLYARWAELSELEAYG